MKRIAVFCGSSAGTNPEHARVARMLGERLVARGLGLVYGGSSVGLMGEVADAVLAAGGEAIGVLPHGLQAREVGHGALTELHLVDSMHERKAMMADKADGFIALPGGLGTLEELFEIWTWAQLGVHHKPLGLLNVAGYYDPLVAFLDHAVHEGFVRPAHRAMALEDRDPDTLLAKFAAFTPPVVDKWLTTRTT